MTSTSRHMETIHAQLTTLLENAQYLLSDTAASSFYGQLPSSSGRYGATGSGPGGTAALPQPPVYSFLAMQAEIRTLEFWRSIIAECIATFFYVMIVLSVSTASTEHMVQTNTAFAAGLAMVMLTACFGRVSGCHTNPAITMGATMAKHISPLRAALFISAQCGGGVAGAALVLGVQGRINDEALEARGGTFGMEFVLTFLIVYAFCSSRSLNRLAATATASTTPHHISTSAGGQGNTNPATTTGMGRFSQMTQSFRNTGSVSATTASTSPTSSLGPLFAPSRSEVFIVGVAYAACLICWKGSLNPARALGSAFVNKGPNRFVQHWIFWVGPILGAITAAFAFEYIFSPRRRALNRAGLRGPHDLEQISIRSEDEMLDDLERAKQFKANIMQDFHNDPYARNQSSGYQSKRNLQEPLYSGSRSMYNQPMYDRYNDGSKSCYSGYDGDRQQHAAMTDRNNMINLRRTRSIHSKLPGSMNTPGTSRRNPYDYLPDEPAQAGTKPDIMQSTIVNENGSSRLMATKTSPRYGDNYANEKLAESYDSPYGSTRVGVAKDEYGDTTYSSLKARPGYTSSSGPDKATGEFQRMSRMRSEYYSPQYNSGYGATSGQATTSGAPAGGVSGGAGQAGYATSRGSAGANY